MGSYTNVKEAFVVVSREETHRGLDPGKVYAKNPVDFVARTNNGNDNFNNNRRANTNNNCNRGPNPNLVCKHCGLIGHTIERCYELNGYPAGFKKKPNLFKQSGYVKKFSGNNVDVSQNASTSSGAILQLSVGHPNGTMAKITAISSLRLTENVVLFKVLVIPEYTVNLLFVNKMIKDNKYFMGFDESKCYIQDLKLSKITGSGSKSGGLYMFDCNNNGKSFAGLCNSGIVCYVSKELWNCRLGHPADQVLSVLRDKIRSKSGDLVSACDICHKEKQTREPFPLSDHKTIKMGDLVHLDVWGSYKFSKSDDKEGDTSNEDGNAGAVSNIKIVPIATQIEENVTFEGNNQSNSSGEGFGPKDEP
ncbi:ribonuclease H-like domain-containing protein [Tanacetum coccineum]